MKLDIQAPLIGELKAELDAIKERAADPTPATQAMAEAIRTAVMDRFDAEADFEGGPWRGFETYDPDYLAEKLEAGHDKKNVRQGTLRGDVHAEGDSDGVSFGVSGASEPYAGVRQADMPFLPVDESGGFVDTPGTPGGDLMEEIDAILAEYLFGPER